MSCAQEKGKIYEDPAIPQAIRYLCDKLRRYTATQYENIDLVFVSDQRCNVIDLKHDVDGVDLISVLMTVNVGEFTPKGDFILSIKIGLRLFMLTDIIKLYSNLRHHSPH